MQTSERGTRSRRGFTLVECLAALIILAIGLVGVFSLFIGGVASHKKGVDQTTAGIYAQKILADLEANLTEAYLVQLAARAAPGGSSTGRSARRRIELKDLTDPDFSSQYRYDLTLAPIEQTRREAYAVTLRVKWQEGGLEQAAVFNTVILRKMDR